MKTSVLLRASLAAAALGAALSAQAVSISLTSAGFDDYSHVPTIDETVLAQFGGYGPLGTLHYVIDTTPFSVRYEGTGGRLDLAFTVDSDIRDSAGTETFDGHWTATGGTESYLNATGSGTYSTSINYAQIGAPNTGRSLTTLVGSVQAVPEPASLAALGLGAVGLLRRRKRA